ncbi:uridine kinase family protein [Dactylosporangium sp. CA-139114]|uniref:uridine kinase family protein n=1 Tax=Dactylosporangium sp. CA-139114 TaxID=3239931 RepID=UPI003D95567A
MPRTYQALAESVLSRPARLGAVRVVGVDGRAGSGKTTFAGRLARALGEGRGNGDGIERTARRVTVLHTDDFLDGWAKLLAWQPRMREWVLEPLGRGEAGAYRRYDWGMERLGDEWTPVEPPDVLVVEGVGSGSVAMRPFLTLGVLVKAPRGLRLRRGLERDGEGLRAEWERWMAAEDEHFAGDATEMAMDVLVDGAPEEGHDPENEYIAVPSGWTARATLEDDPESRPDGEEQSE